MNPCTTDQSSGEDYLGSEPLDPALADRFALFVDVGDWDALTEAERQGVADPTGEGKTANDGGRLRTEVAQWQATFAAQLDQCPGSIVDYACAVTTALHAGDIRISPRRTRLLARRLLAATIVRASARCVSSRDAMPVPKRAERSLPQRAGARSPTPTRSPPRTALAWDATMLQGRDRGCTTFTAAAARPQGPVAARGLPGRRHRHAAIAQLLANETKERAAAFAFAVYPAAVAGHLPIGAEGVNDLGRVAQPMLTVDGEISWQERLSEKNTTHPELATMRRCSQRLGAARRERAQQFLYWCLRQQSHRANPREFEQEFHRCVQVFGKGRTA